MENVYIQTYSANEDMKKDFKGTLEKIAKIGYTGVEFAGGFGDMTPGELTAYLKELGITAISTHLGIGKVAEMADYVKEAGIRYVICPWMDINEEADAHKAAELFNEAGRICREKGLVFGYHNHTQEFKKFGDKYAQEIMIEETDPSLVMFQLDVGWCVKAGVDPYAFLEKYGDRFELIHVKEADNEATGKGQIDWAKIYEIGKKIGIRAYIVEREGLYDDKDIYTCIAEDLEAVKAL